MQGTLRCLREMELKAAFWGTQFLRFNAFFFIMHLFHGLFEDPWCDPQSLKSALKTFKNSGGQCPKHFN